MARAMPAWAITANRLACALDSTASVATIASVVLACAVALVIGLVASAGTKGGRPRPPNSPSHSNAAPQNHGPLPMTTLPAAFTAASAPTVHPSHDAEAEPSPPFKFTVVAPKPAPTLPSPNSVAALAAAA